MVCRSDTDNGEVWARLLVLLYHLVISAWINRGLDYSDTQERLVPQL